MSRDGRAVSYTQTTQGSVPSGSTASYNDTRHYTNVGTDGSGSVRQTSLEAPASTTSFNSALATLATLGNARASWTASHQ